MADDQTRRQGENVAGAAPIRSRQTIEIKRAAAPSKEQPAVDPDFDSNASIQAWGAAASKDRFEVSSSPLAFAAVIVAFAALVTTVAYLT